jgi:hypothetical protein
VTFVPSSNLGKNSGMLCIRRGNLQFAKFHKSFANPKKISLVETDSFSLFSHCVARSEIIDTILKPVWCSQRWVQVFLLNVSFSSKQKDRKLDPVFFSNYLLKHIMSAATFKSAIRHVWAVTAICSNDTTATVYYVITTRFSCRLIAFFLFIFFSHVFTS